jgi:hypothetical protein
MAVWVISLVLFVVALAAHFGVIRPGPDVATWSWIIGFGLLADRVPGAGALRYPAPAGMRRD